MIRRFHLLPLAATATLTACAAQGGFPSLAPRAVEFTDRGAKLPPCLAADNPVQPATALASVVPASDPQLRSRIAQLVEAMRAGQSDFAAALPAAARMVAQAGAAGSEKWIAAQQEVSKLAAARAHTADALAELDALGLNGSAERSLNSDDALALQQAETEARALAERQEAELTRLSGQLGAS